MSETVLPLLRVLVAAGTGLQSRCQTTIEGTHRQLGDFISLLLFKGQ
jgi:hypothetical protein